MSSIMLNFRFLSSQTYSFTPIFFLKQTLTKMEDAKTVLYKQLEKTRAKLQQVKSVNVSQ